MSYHIPDNAGPAGAELRRSADLVGFSMLLLFGFSLFTYEALYTFATLFFYSGASGTGAEILEETVSLVSYIISLAIPIAAVAVFSHIPFKTAFQMKPPKPSVLLPGILLCLGVSVLGTFLSAFVSQFIQIAFGVYPVMPDMTVPDNPVLIGFYIVSTVVIPSFMEEMMFRGVVLQSLRRFGDGFALVISSILFSMAHGNLVQGPNSLLMGVAIGYFVIYTGSLWSGIIIHFTNNLIIVLFELSARHLNNFEYAGAAARLTQTYIFCGVLALVILLPRHPGIFKLPESEVPLSHAKRFAIFFTSVMPLVAIVAAIFITSRFFTPL